MPAVNSTISYLFVAATLFGWSQALERWLGKEFSALAAVLSLITGFFFAALLGQFTVLSQVIAWLGAVFAGYALLRAANHRENLKAAGQQALFWLLAIALARSCAKGTVYWAWDEFSHWGTHVDYLRHFGELLGDPTLLLFADYIPGLSLWRVFFRNQLPQLGVGAAYLADLLIVLACLQALTAGRKPLEKLAVGGLLLGVWIVFFQSLIMTLYVDQLQALLMLSGLVLVSRQAPLPLLALLLAALTGTKHVGLVFALSIAGYYGAHAVWVRHQPLRRSLLETTALAASAVAVWGSWALFVRLHGITAATHLGANPGERLAAFVSTLGAVLNGTYPHAWYLKQGWVPAFSAPAWMLLLGSLGALIAVLARDTGTRRQDRLDLVFSLALMAAYTVFLAGVWSRIPGGADPYSYTRYLAVPLMAVLAHALWRKFAPAGAPGVAMSATLLAIAVGTVVLAPPPTALFGKRKPGLEGQQEYQRIAEGVHQHTQATDTIFYLIEPENIRNYFVFRSAVMPLHLASWVPLKDLTLKRGAADWPDLASRRQLLAAEICKSPYVYAGQLSEQFWQDYQMFFDSPKNESLYQSVKSPAGQCSAHRVWSADPAWKAP